MIHQLAIQVKHIPAVERFMKTDRFRSLRHQLILYFDRREDRTFTRFLRLPSQYEVLCGSVLDFLGVRDSGKRLTVFVLGCSNGAEAYSVASTLAHRTPWLDFVIKAVDLEPRMIRHAIYGKYSSNELFTHSRITPNFVAQTFDEHEGHYAVKPELARHVEFDLVDVLDNQSIERMGRADIVFVQNLLVNLRRRKARIAFRNAFGMMKSRAVMFVDGMDHDLRCRLTRQYGLTPLTEKLDQIYREAREERGAGWPYNYWGIEPYRLHPQEWQRRYGTIFVRDEA